MRIAVIGATQGIGRALTEQARALGHQVVAVGRSIGTTAGPRLTPVRGSILDDGIAETALSGADAVALCLGSKAYGPAAGKRVTVFSEATARVLEAMATAGVDRVVAVTGVGTGESRAQAGLVARHLAMPLVLGAIYEDKARQEELLRASGRDYTILRPTLLTNGPYTGTYRVLETDEALPSTAISRADCADACLKAITQGLWSRRAMTLTGEGRA